MKMSWSGSIAVLQTLSMSKGECGQWRCADQDGLLSNKYEWRLEFKIHIMAVLAMKIWVYMVDYQPDMVTVVRLLSSHWYSMAPIWQYHTYSLYSIQLTTLMTTFNRHYIDIVSLYRSKYPWIAVQHSFFKKWNSQTFCSVKGVTIFFLSHVFFLISVVHWPYICFAPLHEEVDLYLLAFPPSSSPLCLSL